jgi:hypothetical protein
MDHEDEKDTRRKKIKHGEVRTKKTEKEKRTWRVDGRPPVMDKETRDLLINFAEIDSIIGKSSLDRLLKCIVNTDPIHHQEGEDQHRVFKSLLQSCTTWERNTAFNDFKHLMVLLQLSSYISR